MRPIELRQLGSELPYEDTQEAQQRAVDLVRRGELPDQLWLLQHERVITVPRKEAAWANLLVTPKQAKELGVNVVTTTRGGNITYHGPGQWVLYPIVHLQPGERDIRRFVCNLEEAMMQVCRDYGLAPQRSEGETGTWIGDQKIGAIGVRFARWVSSHGIAFNGRTNMEDFNLIVPCGIVDKGVCSLESLEVDHDLGELGPQLAAGVAKRLGRTLHQGPSHLPLMSGL
jgi:lipoyl(octanoyl) transferase